MSRQLSLTSVSRSGFLDKFGRAFHNTYKGPFTESSLGLNIRITKQGSRSLELLKLYLDTGLEIIKMLKYECARPLKILKTINKILNSTLNFTDSQCKSTLKE